MKYSYFNNFYGCMCAVIFQLLYSLFKIYIVVMKIFSEYPKHPDFTIDKFVYR